ncbi:MAG: alcohol dehydrogenase catalytic domain-containing protein [Geminicoccaceae bacterium]
MGPDASGVAIGDSRVVYPWIGCGECDDCERGENLLCSPKVIGTWVDGGYSTHVIVPDARFLVDHGDVPVEVACHHYACSGITAYSAITKTDITRSDQSLLLVGVGGVGMNALLMAKAVLGCRVAVADIDPHKREAAMATGHNAMPSSTTAMPGRPRPCVNGRTAARTPPSTSLADR